jgi:hypothetical protein
MLLATPDGCGLRHSANTCHGKKARTPSQSAGTSPGSPRRKREITRGDLKQMAASRGAPCGKRAGGAKNSEVISCAAGVQPRFTVYPTAITQRSSNRRPSAAHGRDGHIADMKSHRPTTSARGPSPCQRRLVLHDGFASLFDQFTNSTASVT